MYRLVRVFSLAVAVPLLTCFGGAAVAAPTGTVTINGRVPAFCDVVVTAEPGSLNIPDISAGDTDRVVATVNESCNNIDGYTVTVEGTNSTDYTGLFVDSESGDSHPFTLTYDSQAPTVLGVVTDSGAPGINLDKEVRISYDTDLTLTPSSGFTYAETLIFTITAK